MKKIRKKKECEICGFSKKNILHYHHIIPRADNRCTNDGGNVCNLCPNCHSQVHTGELIIIGIYFTSDGYKLLWFKKGEDPPLPFDHWIVKENPLIITLPGDEDD